MFDVRTLDEWDPQWAMKDYGDKRSCYLPAGDKIFEGATSDEAPRQSRGMGHGAMSDDRRCMCCAGPLSSDAEAACGVCRLCQKDPEPGDFDNDPDGMLADGDPAEP
jgi:hypothetical protein